MTTIPPTPPRSTEARPGEARAADRRQAREMAQDALLDVAERLAGVDGASSLSLKRLADEAGVSTMVIYSRFGDRFGLEEALARRASASLIDTLAGDVDTDTTPAGGADLDELGRVGAALWQWAHEHRSRFSLLFLTGHLLDATLRPELDEAILHAGRAIDERLGWAGGGGPAPADLSGLVVLAALVGYLTLDLREQVPRTDAEAGYAALVATLAGLGPL